METKEYFEKVMQDFNQHRNGRSLCKYCQDEGIDYKWLQEYKRTYPNEKKPVQESEPDPQSLFLWPSKRRRPNPSHDAAGNIAFMYSLYESCKMNDIDFGEYVEDILKRMMNGDDDYKSMIPCYYTPGKK